MSTLVRPVCSRAIRMAFSLASAPPLVNKIFSSPSGASAASRVAASPRVSLACCGAMVHSFWAWAAIAAVTRGCWCPMLVFTSWEEKSRYRLPS